MRSAIASTRAPLSPCVANSSAATSRMSALVRAGSLALKGGDLEDVGLGSGRILGSRALVGLTMPCALFGVHCVDGLMIRVVARAGRRFLSRHGRQIAAGTLILLSHKRILRIRRV